jgi:hypothetical protein
VLLKLQPYVQQSVVSQPYCKLAHKLFGHFEILERIGNVAYKLNLPPGSLIPPVFHVSQMKEHRPDYTPVFAELPQLPAVDRKVAHQTREDIGQRHGEEGQLCYYPNVDQVVETTR